MSALRLWILVSLLGYCIGYRIVQRPAEYYDYQVQPHDYQFQPFDNQPSYYSSHSTYSYPEHHKSYQRPYMPDKPSYYGSYHYFYPSLLEYPEPHKSYPRKPEPKYCPSYNEGQKLLQVYRLIWVIEIFRTLPSKQKKMTSLDQLVERLTSHSLQDQLVELVHHVEGYEEVVSLDRGPPGIKLDMFVDDTHRLIRAIQRALNALDLGDYYGEHYHLKRHGCCHLHRELCDELRQLRDQANALTVGHIKKERVEHIKAKVKQAFDTDILEDLDEGLESRLLDLESVDIDVADVFNRYEQAQKFSSSSGSSYPFDESHLDHQLATALNLYLQQQQQLAEAQQAKEELMPTTTRRPYTTGYPRMSTTTYRTSTTYRTTTPASNPYKAKEGKDSWFASLFGKEIDAPNHQMIDVSRPAELIEPEAGEVAVHEDAVGMSSVDSHGLARTDEKTSSEPPVMDKVNNEEMEVTTDGGDRLRQLPEYDHYDEGDVVEYPLEDIFEEEIPIDEEELPLIDPLYEEELPEGVYKKPQVFPILEEDRYPVEPLSVEEMAMVPELSIKEGERHPVEPPSAEEITDDDDEETQGHSIEDKEPLKFVDEPSEHQQPDQHSVPRGHSSQVTTTEGNSDTHSTTAVPQPDARSFAKEETIKVLNLLEEAEGFTELRKRIFDSDVDQLVDGLKNVEAGIRWSEMLNALQKLVTEKKLDSGERIVGVLEQWKTGVRGQLDNGYFNRTYGEGANGEAHKVGDYDEDPQLSRDYDTEEFHPVDANHPDIAYLIPHIIHQLRLGNISEQEQLTMAAIFEDQWPLIVEEAFRSEQED